MAIRPPTLAGKLFAVSAGISLAGGHTPTVSTLS